MFNNKSRPGSKSKAFLTANHRTKINGVVRAGLYHACVVVNCDSEEIGNDTLLLQHRRSHQWSSQGAWTRGVSFTPWCHTLDQWPAALICWRRPCTDPRGQLTQPMSATEEPKSCISHLPDGFLRLPACHGRGYLLPRDYHIQYSAHQIQICPASEIAVRLKWETLT